MWVFRIPGDFASLDALSVELFDAGARGLEERDGEVLAYFPERVPLPYSGTWERVADEDWIEAWKRDLKPVTAGPFWVRAPWHPPAPKGIDLVIEPGMAFGTGHHETTQLALAALAQAVRPGMRILDLGTGSGVLAIAAAKLGAEVLALDIDPVAVAAARVNAERNGVEVAVRAGSLDATPGPFDLIVANLYAELHQRLAPGYAERLAQEGVLLLTGILRERLPLVEEALKKAKLPTQAVETAGEWVLIRAGR